MKQTYLTAIVILLCNALSACVEAPQSDPGATRNTPSLLVMGDSMLAWNSNSSQGVADHLERELGYTVTDRSVSGSFVIYALPISGSMGLRIRSQYRKSAWDWVVLNGGGNDLLLAC